MLQLKSYYHPKKYVCHNNLYICNAKFLKNTSLTHHLFKMGRTWVDYWRNKTKHHYRKKYVKLWNIWKKLLCRIFELFFFFFCFSVFSGGEAAYAVKRYTGLYTGPYFDTSTTTNITTQLGTHAYLPCKVKQLGNKSVSWIRRRDAHILTVDRYTFIADDRFQVWIFLINLIHTILSFIQMDLFLEKYLICHKGSCHHIHTDLF